MSAAMILGFAATAVSVASSVPQTYRMIRFRRDAHALMGLSVWTPTIVMVNEIMVFVYGRSLHEMPLWLPQVFAAPFHLFVVLFILRSRLAYHRSRVRAEVPAFRTRTAA